MSARPVTSECRRQPPSSSGSTCSRMASEASKGLDTASTAPLRITLKSASAAYQDEDPYDNPSVADAHGVSRRRWYCAPSLPSKDPIPRAPIVSGMRAPDDSPRKTSGIPRCVVTRFIWPILRPLVAPLDDPITVKSLATSPASRWLILPKPAILPSAGVLP